MTKNHFRFYWTACDPTEWLRNANSQYIRGNGREIFEGTPCILEHTWNTIECHKTMNHNSAWMARHLIGANKNYNWKHYQHLLLITSHGHSVITVIEHSTIPYEICGWQKGRGATFTSRTLVFPCQCHSTNAAYTYPISV